MATRTSVGSGLWSNAAVWDTGVPVDGDGINIAAGHTIIFDVDQSSFVNGINGLLINTGSTLEVSTSPGNYYLAVGTNGMSGAGTFRVGSASTPYPVNCKFIAKKISNNGTLIGCKYVEIYGQEPNTRWVKIMGVEVIGQTELSVDTDVTLETDFWKSGAEVFIVDVDVTNQDYEKRTIGSITSNTINITSGLSAQKQTGAYIVLIDRNVELIGINGSTTGGTAINGTGYVSAEIHTFAYAGGSRNIELHGIIYETYFGISSFGGIADVICGAGGYTLQTGGPFLGKLSGLFFGAGRITSGGPVDCFDGVDIVGQIYPGSHKSIFRNCKFLGGANNPINFYNGWDCEVEFYNCLFSSVFSTMVEWDTYANSILSVRAQSKLYITSINHNQIPGAFKSFTRGGIYTSQVSVVPPEYTVAYIMPLTSTTWFGFSKASVIVPAGQSVSVEVCLRKTESMTFLPRVFLMSDRDDPLLDATPVDNFTMTDSIDTWESDTFIIDNSSNDYDKEYTLWFVGKNATGSMYSAYKIEYSGSGGSGGSVKILPYSGKVGL